MSYLDKNTPKGNTIVFDIETTVLNKYTDERVGEVYSVCSREIYDNKVNEEIEEISKGKKVNYNDGNYLKTFISEPTFYRNMKEFLSWLKDKTVDNRRECYAHNLDFENNAILNELKPNSLKDKKKLNHYFEYKDYCIFRTNNNPISLIYEELPNVNFKCSYALTGYSIKSLGKMIGIPKLDYDYEIIRRPYNELTELDKKYNDNDVVISACAIVQQALIRREHIEELPLTFTSAMNRDKSNFIRKNFGHEYLTRLMEKRERQLDYKDYNFYKLVEKCKKGGLTALNPNYINKMVDGVFSYDITSSYPYVLCFCRFPRYDKETFVFRVEKNMLEEERMKLYDTAYEFFNKYLKKGIDYFPSSVRGYVGEIIIENVKAKKINGKLFPFLPLSTAKVSGFKNETDKSINGKIINCKLCSVIVNEYDFEQLLECYDFEVAFVKELYVSTHDEYLSLGEISYIFNCFIEKQKIKPFKEKMKAEYMNSKQKINAQYGQKIQNPIKGTAEVINGDVIFYEFFTKHNEEFDLKHSYLSETDREELYRQMVFNKKVSEKNYSIDISSDGMYVSSKAKLRLIKFAKMLINSSDEMFEVIPIYADTDSCKFIVENKKPIERNSIGGERIRKDIKHCEITSSLNIIDNEDENSNINYQKMKENFLKNLFKNIDDFNNKIIYKNEENYRFTEYCNRFKVSKNMSECISELGTWDLENEKIDDKVVPYNNFKSLGAKKYFIINDEDVKTIVSGLSTEVGEKIKKYAIENNLDIAKCTNEIMNIGTLFDRSLSGRTTAYKEKRTHEEIEKLSYEGLSIVGYSCKMIENCDYTLSLTENDFEMAHDTFNTNLDEIKRVFLETEDKELVLLTKKEDIEQYLRDKELVHKKYIYKMRGVLNV